MEYTVNLRRIGKTGSKLMGVADVTLEKQFKLNGIRIFKGEEEGDLAVVMPYYQKLDPKTGKHVSQSIFTLSEKLGERVRATIKEMYENDIYNVSSNPGYFRAIESNRISQRPLVVMVKNVTTFANPKTNPDLRGFANLAIAESGSENKININSIRIRECTNKEGGKFLSVSMPREKVPVKGGQFTYNDQCHPISGELRTEINKGVIDEYKHKVGEYTIEDELAAGKTGENAFDEKELSNSEINSLEADRAHEGFMNPEGIDDELPFN